MAIAFVIDDYRQRLALYCNTEDRAFGPVLSGFDLEEQAEAFLQRVRVAEDKDPREVSEQRLREIYNEFAVEWELKV